MRELWASYVFSYVPNNSRYVLLLCESKHHYLSDNSS